MRQALFELLTARNGHFELESGHHGEFWLELDALFLRPARVAPLAAELARRVSRHGVDAVCGPMTGGAFLAQAVATELNAAFYYAERFEGAKGGALYSVAYRVPPALRAGLAGGRVAVVDDVINAGSALRAAWADLERCGASVVAVGALLVLGGAGRGFAEARGVPVETLAALPNGLWAPAECPLCASGVPLEVPGRA